MAGIRVFNAAIQQMAQSAKDNLAIQNARQKMNQDKELFDLKKKQADLDLKEAEMSGQLTQFQLENQKAMRDQFFKQQKDIFKGQQAAINQQEQKTNMALNASKTIAGKVYQNDPSVQMYVKNMAQQSVAPFIGSRDQYSQQAQGTMRAMQGYEDEQTQTSVAPQQPRMAYNQAQQPQQEQIQQQEPQAMPEQQAQQEAIPSVFDVPYNPQKVELTSKGTYETKKVDQDDFYFDLINKKKQQGYELTEQEQDLFDKKVFGENYLKQKKEEKESIEEDRKKTELVISGAEETLNTISEIEKGIKYFGAAGNVPPFPFEYEKINWSANVDRLTDKLVLDLMTQMKQASKTGATGFGSLSEKELQVLKNSATALRKGMSEEDAKKYIDIIKEKTMKVINNKKSEGKTTSEQQEQPKTGDFSYMW